jgi:hypothetical protein
MAETSAASGMTRVGVAVTTAVSAAEVASVMVVVPAAVVTAAIKAGAVFIERPVIIIAGPIVAVADSNADVGAIRATHQQKRRGEGKTHRQLRTYRFHGIT